MGALLCGLTALSTFHPEANPASPAAGQHVYDSRAARDKQIVRILGKVRLQRGEGGGMGSVLGKGHHHTQSLPRKGVRSPLSNFPYVIRRPLGVLL